MRAGERGCRAWLRTVATRHRLDDARPGAHVVDNRSLEPREHDVRSLTAHALLHAAKSVVHDGTVAALYVEEHVASTVGETGSAETGDTKQLGQRSAATLRELRGQAAQDLLEAPHHDADATRSRWRRSTGLVGLVITPARPVAYGHAKKKSAKARRCCGVQLALGRLLSPPDPTTPRAAPASAQPAPVGRLGGSRRPYRPCIVSPVHGSR